MIKPDKVMPTDQLRLKYVKSLQTNRTRREQDITVTPELSPGMVILINTLRGWLIHEQKPDDPYDFDNEVSDSSLSGKKRKRK